MTSSGDLEPRPDQRPPSALPGLGAGFRGGTFRGRLVIIFGTGPNTGLFVYSGPPAQGNLVGSWTATAGTDPFGNPYPAGINVTSGVLSGVTVNALNETINPGPFLLRAASGLTITTFTATGVNNWVAPAGITSVAAWCWGAGGGGDGSDVGAGESGGGGGAFSFLGNIGVTPTNTYHATVGAAGAANTNGGSSSFAGDTLTVTANGGQGAVDPTVNPPGGAASTAPAGVVSFAGGSGGGSGGAPHGGGGGGGPASNISAGNNGTQGSGSAAGVGGATPVSTIFPSGSGGNGGTPGGGAGNAGVAPGGGGGGGGDNGAAGTGANGQVILVYSSGSVATQVMLAGAAGTDPVTTLAFPAGITSSEPTFGTGLTIHGGIVSAFGTTTVINVQSADWDINTVGKGLRVAEGSNAKQGTATLAAGTVVVANTSVTANSRIFLTAQTTGAGPGALRVSARTAGTSFTITSSNAADTSLVAWEIFEPG